MRRLTAAMVVALVAGGCSLLPGTPPQEEPPSPPASAPATELQAMTKAYGAFVAQLGSDAKAVSVSYGVDKSTLWVTKGEQAYVYANGAVTRTADVDPIGVPQKQTPLAVWQPAVLLKQANAKVGCNKATGLTTREYYNGFAYPTLTCDDALGKRTIQVDSSGTPIEQVDLATKEGLTITLFGAILRLRNILTSFDDFEGQDRLTQRQLQDYSSLYLDLAAEFRRLRDSDRESIVDDVVFEIELVKQVEINVDYILMLVDKWRQARGDGEDKEIKVAISRAIGASPTLRNKRDLVEEFVESVSATGDIDAEWKAFVATRRNEELRAIIEDQALRPVETRALVEQAFRDDTLPTSGAALTRILPPMSRFAPDGAVAAKRRTVVEPDRLLRQVRWARLTAMRLWRADT